MLNSNEFLINDLVRPAYQETVHEETLSRGAEDRDLLTHRRRASGPRTEGVNGAEPTVLYNGPHDLIHSSLQILGEFLSWDKKKIKNKQNKKGGSSNQIKTPRLCEANRTQSCTASEAKYGTSY